jgi:hypothetical protein
MSVKAHQRYRLENGQIVPGATTVIGNNLGWNKNVLMGWARKQALMGNDPDLVKQKAADIGTIAHYLCECNSREKEPDLSEYPPKYVETAQKCYQGYLDFIKRHNVKDIQPEMQLVSQKYRYGGTIDMLYRTGNKLILGDIKTSSGIYVEHKIQLASYYHLALENNYKIDEVYLLHFDKKGNFATYQIRKLDIYWQIFKKCLDLHYMKMEV